MDYTIEEIAEFAKAANSDLGSGKYNPNDLIEDYSKSIVIIKQLLKRSPDKELCDAIMYIMSKDQYESGERILR